MVLFSCCFSVIVITARLGSTDAERPLVHLCIDAGDVLADRAQTTMVLQLARGRLEPQVEQLFLGLTQLVDQTVVIEATQLSGSQFIGPDCHQTSPPSRRTKRHFIGSLCIARRCLLYTSDAAGAQRAADT